MPRCCGGASCSCAIEAGSHIQVAGIGTATDPFVIIGDIDLEVTDNTTFDLGLAGTGTLANPWTLTVQFASTAKLNDLPDVTAIAPTNGQVLGWDSATSQWTPREPTTAAAGTVTHDTSLAGDGSAGTPLQVQEDPAGYLTTRAPGLGVSDTGINQMVRKFPTVAARLSATPAPTLNTLSLVDSVPGAIDYWTGSAWASAGGSFTLAAGISGEEFYQLSGAYAGGRLKTLFRNLLVTTDTFGLFTVLDPTEVAGQAGIMACNVQVLSPATGIPVVVQVEGTGGGVVGHAFRVDDGTPYALGTINVSVTAFLY